MTAECQGCQKPVEFDPNDARPVTVSRFADTGQATTEKALWVTCPHCKRRNYFVVREDD